uniref:Uncharacterized protein n=1 Tax=Arundo donax TaxID=35708 RepID=A0A0A9C0F9_ARUDO
MASSKVCNFLCRCSMPHIKLNSE